MKVGAVIFDLDDTLIYTKKVQSFRENRDRDGLSENLDKTKIFSPIKKILNSILEKEIPLGLVTNSPRWYVDELLSYHEIKDFFKSIVCYDDVGPGGIKPSPLGIKAILKMLDVKDPYTAIYVGDQDTDIIASYEAGVRPIAPSWATARPIDQVPAAIVNSETLISGLDDIEDLALIADRVALNRSFDFPKLQMNFLPLNEHGQVVPLKKEHIKLIAFGRYFSQGSALTARLHDAHSLSREIFKKEESEQYVIPEYYVDLLAKVVSNLPAYAFESQDIKFDILTVIPSKKERNPRLENLLKRISKRLPDHGDYIADLFEFGREAKSLKTLGSRDNRDSELERNFSIKDKYKSSIAGKRVLIIDDVITTGATFSAAFQILEGLGAESFLGVCLAKTVSVREPVKLCPKCERVLKVRRNSKTGIHFYSCSGFYEKDQCRYTCDIKIKDCPRCGKDLVKRYNKRDDKQFLSCSSYGSAQACGYTDDVEEI